MAFIKLTRGKYTLIDDENYEWLNQWKWYLGTGGYAVRKPRKPNKIIHMHRDILKKYGVNMDRKETDHINLDKLDNRKQNLRAADATTNKQNAALRVDNTSGYKGVSWHKQDGLWEVRVKKNKKQIRLGLFRDKKEAAKVYNYAAKKYFGEFARLNQMGGQIGS